MRKMNAVLLDRRSKRTAHVRVATALLLCYFVNFIHGPVPNDSNELCILSNTEIFVVSFICFYPTKRHLEGGNNYADKLLF